MKMLKTSLIALTSISLLLGACGTSEQATNTQNTTTTSTEKTETKPQEVAKTEATDKPKETAKTGSGHKGQVVQSGKYHFELSPDLHEGAIHLDTTIHGESDKAITNAKLVAQVHVTLPIKWPTCES